MHRGNILATILFATIVTLGSSTRASADTTSLVGKPAPDFSLTTLTGKIAKLSAQKGKVVVICFWQSNDAADQTLLPYIQQFSANKDWASKGVVVWAIAIDNPRQMAATGRKLLKDNQYTFDVPVDSADAVSRNYLIQMAPTTVVVGSDEIIKSVNTGFWPGTTPHLVATAIERAIAESGKLDAANWIAKPAPAFLITAPNGAAIRLDARVPGRADYDEKYVNKVVLITFWANRNSSTSLLSHLQGLAANREFVRKGLMVMAVATGGQTPPEVRKFLLDNHYTFEVPFGTPFASWEDSLGREMVTFVIGRRGVVTSVFAGGGPGVTKQLDDAVVSALDSPNYLGNPISSLIGKPAPDFSLTTLEGKTVKLSDQRGKVVLLDFWASWCGPCLVTLPHTQKLSDNRDLASKGLVVWAVTQPDDKQSLADAQGYVTASKFTFTVPCDSGGTVSHAYGIIGYPMIVIVGRDGLIKTSTASLWVSGAGGSQFQPKMVDDAIASALAESPSAVSSTVEPPPPPAPSSPATPVVPSTPPAPSEPANPGPSSPATPQGTDPLANTWQSDAFAGQTFHFRLNGDAIEVYGSQQEPLGVLQAKEKKGVIDVYQGLVQVGPLTQCPGGRGLMQIKAWNDSRLDAKIETPLNGPGGTTCGGVMGTGRLVRWQQVSL